MKSLPQIGMGTFIGIEHEPIVDLTERHKVVENNILDGLKTGYRHFDLALAYHNLPAIKSALQIAFKTTEEGGLGLERSQLWLTMRHLTPLPNAELDNLLSKIDATYFDLFLVDHPECSGTFDNVEALTKMWTTLSSQLGDKIKRIGVSNYYHPHLTRLLTVCKNHQLPPPYANEIEVNPCTPNTALVNYCLDHDIKVIAYSPLGYANAPLILNNDTLMHIADTVDASPAQVALAWNMKRGVTVIPKSLQPKRLLENYLATKVVATLTANDIDAITKNGLNLDTLCATAEDALTHASQLTWSAEVEAPDEKKTVSTDDKISTALQNTKLTP